MTNLLKTNCFAFLLLVIFSCSTDEGPEVAEELVFTLILEEGAEALPEVIPENIVLTDEQGVAFEQSPLESGNTYQYSRTQNDDTTIGVHFLGTSFGNKKLLSYIGIAKGTTWLIKADNGFSFNDGVATVSVLNFPKNNNPFYPIANSKSSNILEDFEGFGDQGDTWDSAVFVLRLAQSVDTLMIGNTENLNSPKYVQINNVRADEQIVLDFDEDFQTYEKQVLFQNPSVSSTTTSVIGYRPGIDSHRIIFKTDLGQNTWLGYVPGYQHYLSSIYYVSEGNRVGYLKLGEPVQENEIVLPPSTPQILDGAYHSFSAQADAFQWGLFRFSANESQIIVRLPLPMDTNQLLTSLPDELAEQYPEILENPVFGSSVFYRSESNSTNPLTWSLLESTPSGAWSLFELN